MKKQNFLAGILAGLLVAFTLFVAGCDNQKVSWETQEQARTVANQNASFNANVWRNANQPNLNVTVIGDSSISEKCATGDGWPSVDLKNDQGVTALKLKCSTVSANIGCLTDADFKARPVYADKDKGCDTSLPFPLPKIQK